MTFSGIGEPIVLHESKNNETEDVAKNLYSNNLLFLAFFLLEEWARTEHKLSVLIGRELNSYSGTIIEIDGKEFKVEGTITPQIKGIH